MMIKPLSGIKVIDLSRVMAGPWATQNLADWGAEVIKIEKPNVGDDTRAWGPPFIKSDDGSKNISAYYLAVNRGKKVEWIDITTKQGQGKIHELIKDADVFIENFKVGSLAKYNLDYESVKAIKNDIIYCSISGYGQEGSLSHLSGYDYVIQAEAGLMSITGEKDGEPMRVGVPIVDIMTGMYSLSAILAGIINRQNTGNGVYIDVSLFDVMTSTLSTQAMNYLLSGNIPQRIGNTHPNIVPYQIFNAKDGQMVIAVGNDSQFQSFCAAIGVAELSENPKFRTNADRVNNRDEIVAIISRHIATKNIAEWSLILNQAGIPNGKVNDISEVLSHPRAIESKSVITSDFPEVKGVKTIKNPVGFK